MIPQIDSKLYSPETRDYVQGQLSENYRHLGNPQAEQPDNIERGHLEQGFAFLEPVSPGGDFERLIFRLAARFGCWNKNHCVYGDEASGNGHDPNFRLVQPSPTRLSSLSERKMNNLALYVRFAVPERSRYQE